MILANVAYFGGNAALDLWQVAGPGRNFSGTIRDHQHIVSNSEAADEYTVLVLDTNIGTLKLDVPDAVFNGTDNGQHATGTLDARGILGHDEGLRVLNVDGQAVFQTQENVLNRVIGQTFILLVVFGVGYLACSWIVRDLRGRTGTGA